MTTKRLDETVARKVLTTVDAGLCKGVGQAEPGHMCVEAAVCFALDLPHGDNPPCVGSAVRAAKIQLNDCAWSSDMARARGLRKLSLAQLGSKSINQVVFAKRLTFLVITKMLPKTLRLAKLEKEAKACEEAPDSDAADAAANAAYAADAADDLVLTEFADLMLQVLVEMKSPGCEWLYLTELAA